MIARTKVVNLVKRSLKLGGIRHAQWMLTRRCNYKCRGCKVWGDQEGPELSTGEVKRGLDILSDLGVLEIVFSGGNPLIRDDIGEILNYASDRFITTVYDNGSLAAQKLDSLRNVDFVAISIDTLEEKKNDYLKGTTGAWRRAMNSIETLKKEGIPVGVSPTISQQNLDETIDFTKYFVSRGIPVWYCFYWYDYPFENAMFSIGKKNQEYEIVDRKALADVFSTLKEMKKKSNNIYITNKTLEALRKYALTGKRKWSCKALSDFLVVDPKGRVAGCHSREPVASVFELPEIWNGAMVKRLRKEYSECENCAYLCYVFYSVHPGLSGTLEILKDQWDNAKIYVREVKAKLTPQTPSLRT